MSNSLVSAIGERRVPPVPPSAAHAPREWTCRPDLKCGGWIYEGLSINGTDYHAHVWLDEVVGAYVVAVTSPSHLRQPVCQRLGFRCREELPSPDDLKLAGVVARRGEEVGASFLSETDAVLFIRGLWALS